MRTRRLERLETEDSDQSDTETGADERRGGPCPAHSLPPQPRPPPMASSDQSESVISAVSQWRQRAVRAGQCQSQAAETVLSGVQSPLQPLTSGPCLPSLP